MTLKCPPKSYVKVPKSNVKMPKVARKVKQKVMSFSHPNLRQTGAVSSERKRPKDPARRDQIGQAVLPDCPPFDKKLSLKMKRIFAIFIIVFF